MAEWLAAQRQRRRRQLVKAGLDLFTIATDGNRLAELLDRDRSN